MRSYVIRHEKAIEEIESVISRVPELGEYRVTTELYNAGGRMRREYVFFEHPVPVAPDDMLNPTLTLLNSYDTKWPFSVILGAFRLFCKNGLIIGLMLFHIKKRHVCGLEELHIKEGVSTALSRFFEQVTEWKRWAGEILPQKVYNRVMEAMDLGKKGTEGIQGRMFEEAEDINDNGFPIISVWLFYNVLTWYITYRSVSLNHKVELEERLRKAIVHFRCA